MDPNAPHQDVGLVDRILDKRYNQETGDIEYLISWQGYDAQGVEFEDTWEPEKNVLGEDLLEEFERSKEIGDRMRFQDVGDDDMTAADSAGEGTSTNPRFKTRMSIPYNQHYTSPPMSSPPPPPPKVTRPPGRPPGSVKRGRPPKGTTVNNRNNLKNSAMPPSRDSRDLAQLPGYVPNSVLPILHDTTAHNGQGPYESSKRKLDDGHGMTTRKQNRTTISEVVHVVQGHGSNGREREVANNSAIHFLKIDNDAERNFMKSTVGQSRLIRDEGIRSDLIHFLQYHGLQGEGTLRKAPAWLIEIKSFTEKPGSMFLAVDTVVGSVKALYIPEWMVHQRRSVNPAGHGIVIVERWLVSALMAGDIQGSGLIPGPTPSLSSSSSATPLKEAQRDGDTATADEKAAPASSESSSTPAGGDTDLSQGAFSCGWQNCKSSFVNIELLSSHVQSSHISPLSTSSMQMAETSPPVVTTTATMDTLVKPSGQDTEMADATINETAINSSNQVSDNDQLNSDNTQLTSTAKATETKDTTVTTTDTTNTSAKATTTLSPPNTEQQAAQADKEQLAISEPTTEASWQVRHDQLHEAYQTLTAECFRLGNELTQVREKMSANDQNNQRTQTMMQNTTRASIETAKRIEAKQEWEQKKFEQYEALNSSLVRNGEQVVSKVMRMESQETGEGSTDVSRIAAGKAVSTPARAGTRAASAAVAAERAALAAAAAMASNAMDPMMAHSKRSVADIHKMLATSKEEYARVERENEQLAREKQELDQEFKDIQRHYQQTLIKMAEYERRDLETSLELAKKNKNIEACKEVIDQQRQKSMEAIAQLQAKIQVMMRQNKETDNEVRKQLAEKRQLQAVVATPAMVSTATASGTTATTPTTTTSTTTTTVSTPVGMGMNGSSIGDGSVMDTPTVLSSEPDQSSGPQNEQDVQDDQEPQQEEGKDDDDQERGQVEGEKEAEKVQDEQQQNPAESSIEEPMVDTSTKDEDVDMTNGDSTQGTVAGEDDRGSKELENGEMLDNE